LPSKKSPQTPAGAGGGSSRCLQRRFVTFGPGSGPLPHSSASRRPADCPLAESLACAWILHRGDSCERPAVWSDASGNAGAKATPDFSFPSAPACRALHGGSGGRIGGRILTRPPGRHIGSVEFAAGIGGNSFVSIAGSGDASRPPSSTSISPRWVVAGRSILDSAPLPQRLAECSTLRDGPGPRPSSLRCPVVRTFDRNAFRTSVNRP